MTGTRKLSRDSILHRVVKATPKTVMARISKAKTPKDYFIQMLQEHLAAPSSSTSGKAEPHEQVSCQQIFDSKMEMAETYAENLQAQPGPILGDITFVTGNANKLREVQQMMGAELEHAVRLSNKSIDLPELQGLEKEIAKVKAQTAARRLRTTVLVEDTVLEFDALPGKGMPGPYIKWFLETENGSHEEKLANCEGLRKMLLGFDDFRATARCTFTLQRYPHQDELDSGEEPALPLPEFFEGECHGQIVRPRGSTKFGWDPVFEPNEQSHQPRFTFAEMPTEEKNAISHRSRALAALKAYFLSGADATAKHAANGGRSHH